MFKVISYIVGLVVIGYLSFHYPLFAFVLLAVLGLILIYVFIAAIVRLLGKTIRGKWFYLPLSLIGMILFGLIISLMAPLEEPVIHTGNASEELAYAYQMD